MKNYIRHFAIFLFFILFFILVYAPAYHGHYVMGEDYGGLWTSKWPLISKKSFASFLRDFPFEGRLLEVFYIYITYLKYVNPLKTLDAASTVRLVNIIAVGLLACVLYIIFKVNKFKTFHAFLLSILICTLPPFQYYVGIICCGGSFIFSAIFSSLATLVIFLTAFKDNRKITNTAIAILMAIVLLGIALNFHQSTTMIYWSLALVPLITLKDESFIKKMGIPYTIYLFTGFTSMVLYYINVKIMLFLIDFTINNIARRGSLIGINEISHRIIDFINYPLYTALNLWNIFPNKMIGLSVGIIILASIFFGFGRVLLNVITDKNDKNLLFDSLCRYSLIIILLLLSYFPNTILKESINFMIPKFRLLIGLETTVVLLLYWGLFMNTPDFFRYLLNFSANLRDKLITFGLIILTIVATFYAHQNINNFVKLHTGELEYVKNTIQEHGISTLSKDSKIYTIPSNVEFLDYHSPFTDLTSMARGPATEMFHLALYELGVNSEIHVIFYENYDNFLPKDRNALIIDMRNYQKKAYKGLNIPLSVEPFF